MSDCIKCGSKKACWMIRDKENKADYYCDPCFKKYDLADYKKAYSVAKDKVLDNVRVFPGQDPYTVAFSALFQEESNMINSAKVSAEKETVAKYKIEKRHLQSLIK